MIFGHIGHQFQEEWFERTRQQLDHAGALCDLEKSQPERQHPDQADGDLDTEARHVESRLYQQRKNFSLSVK